MDHIAKRRDGIGRIAPSLFAGTVGAYVADAMRSAQTEVFVVSPYFIPAEVGLESMRQLSARGVHLRRLTNSLASTDEPLVHTGYARYRMPMLQMGVEIYELGPGLAKERNRLGRFGNSLGSIHTKIAVIDHKRLFVGSMIARNGETPSSASSSIARSCLRSSFT